VPRRLEFARAVPTETPPVSWIGRELRRNPGAKAAARYYQEAAPFILENPEGSDGEIPSSLVWKR